ncbi:hypothetical protein B0T26DRAFT_148745 [Lasiosphaeria miniovina]|uniref:Cholesterol oxidase n=1 Tax=Lasiosphaeria miniovina TaxID=1954250 RepID=A0AA40B5B1_9PEZI|nr:uncharacterized protein B0T26DRAFT_148745 [Lasiosphaeria miniovina]KAK0727899.1 hypothetical protein B0T26DRAFT_148745 [Lasiosphaeria miniovina]
MDTLLPEPSPALQINGAISPPPTPSVNINIDATEGILRSVEGHDSHDKDGPTESKTLNGTKGSLYNRAPASPSPTPSPSSSPTPRPAATFTEDDETHEYDPPQRHQTHPIPPYGIHENEVGGPQTRSRTKIRSYTDDKGDLSFPRLSKPVELLRGSYDVVVIGSGYGGGVAASRMARTGQSVCVLERGREKWPGEYPTGTVDATKELHFSGTLAPGITNGKMVEGGDPTGMYHMFFGRGQNAVVCNGLGGTSLMNANVFMEADEKTLSMKAWPPEIRNNVHVLNKYYKKAEKVLEPETYPDDWPSLPKLNMLQKQAESLGFGDKFRKVRQTTRFRNGPNSCGVEMSPSALTGQDCTGVNDGSKTTTLVTYLADAWNWGAEMFCECEVRYVEKAEDGYRVFFAWHGRNRGFFKANLHGDLMWVHAKKAVFLGAGAIASTEILLRSKAMGLDMSSMVGQNMSGNGDILAFGYNTDENVNAIGKPVPSPYKPIGPTITGVIDCRDGHNNPLDGYVIEEGAVPHALAHVLQAMLDLMPGSTPPSGETTIQRTQAALARFGSRFLGPYFKNGAVERTQVYLIMSHDSNQAVLTLQDDKPVLEFLGVARSHHVNYLNNILKQATEAVGGTLVQSPFYALMGQEVTVHPIGGACMARDNTGATGVTNHVGAVFIGNGPETYDGLIVTDAAVIPTALGANPFATITALAERAVEAYADSKYLTISDESNGLLDLFGEPQHVPKPDNPTEEKEKEWALEEQDSLSAANEVIRSADGVKASGMGFTEVMSGFVHANKKLYEDNKATYELAYRTAKSLCEGARFFLSVQAFNTRDMIKHDQHRGLLTGTFVCPAIPGSPFMVQRGEFNLFILSHKAPGTRNLTYDFDMTGVNGRKLHFHGYKVVDSSVALAPVQFWKSTSTLYVTISQYTPGASKDLDDEDAWRQGEVVAKGIMNIQPADFFSEIMTMSPTGSNILKKMASAASFLTFFTRKSLALFLAPLTPLQYPTQTYSGFVNNTLPDQSIAIYASDNVCTRMHVWEPTSYPDNDLTKVQNLFMIPGASVDHQIYALPTIPFNAVNYFTRAGYRVFVTVHRIGQLMVAENMWTTYDARLDIKACLEYIRKDYGPEKVYTIAHCMGSVAFSTGLLDGTIPASWIKGITCSQVFMNPIWGATNMAKVMAGPIPMDKLYTMLAGTWFSCSTSRDDGLVQNALNQVLRLYPQSRREICNNAACHRTSLVFGRCWNHSNLNEATHRQIDRFFGGVNMRLLNLLMRQGSQGHVMTNGPLFEDLTTPENVARLKGIPIMLFVGRDNAVLSPEATERTYEILCDTFGGAGEEGGDYKRRVVPGYGHLDPWMGRNAWKDIYPFVREEVDRVVRGDKYRFEEPDDRFAKMVHGGELLY